MRFTFTDRQSGFSLPPFNSGNLALHVGDDPALVARNRGVLEADFPRLQFMNQVHGNDVADVLAPSSPPEADALITTEVGIALVVLVADCIPLLLWDDRFSVIAAVHVGRRGLVNGVALKTVERMREDSSGQITGVMGPSICGACYEVDAATYEEVVAKVPESKSETRIGTLGLDLPNGLYHQLLSANVRVDKSGECTLENEAFFSYRRAQITGRQAGIITL